MESRRGKRGPPTAFQLQMRKMLSANPDDDKKPKEEIARKRALSENENTVWSSSKHLMLAATRDLFAKDPQAEERAAKGGLAAAPEEEEKLETEGADEAKTVLEASFEGDDAGALAEGETSDQSDSKVPGLSEKAQASTPSQEGQKLPPPLRRTLSLPYLKGGSAEGLSGLKDIKEEEGEEEEERTETAMQTQKGQVEDLRRKSNMMRIKAEQEKKKKK